jgi:hypothetical protein
MAQIYDTDGKFDFQKLTFLKPIAVVGGNYFIRVRLNGSPLYVQPPKCKTKQGIIKTGKKYYTDLMFTNENESFIHWMETLETYCQNVIYDNRATWFDGELDKHDIENYFTSPLKVFKSGKYYISRANVSLNAGEALFKVYDENENIIELESVDDKLDAMTILEIQGIRCSAKSFQIDIELKQMMLLTPKDIFDKCVLKTDTVPFIESRKSDTDSGERQIQPIDSYLEKEEDAEAVSPPPTDSYMTPTNQPPIDMNDSSEYLVEDATLDAVTKNEETLDEVTKNEENQNYGDEIEEFEFHLEDLSTNETIQIKQRNDVYYEMYREAKRKAKIARDLALASYLEANRIKNTYMLEDIKDSDDESEMETEDDPQGLE